VAKFTLEQDASIGHSIGGTAIPDLSVFEGTGGRRVPFSLGLISAFSFYKKYEARLRFEAGTREPPHPSPLPPLAEFRKSVP